MKTASKNDIRKFKKRRYKMVEIPEIDLQVRIQSLTEREKSDYETQILSKSGRGLSRHRLADASRRLVALCAVDEKGDRLFGSSDVAELADVDALVITRIAKDCEVHAGMSDGDVEELVEAAKNSPDVHDDSSPSA